MMESIKVENIIKSYDGTPALNGISVEINPGELFFLLGASGCGKSTLLRCIAGLETPDSGDVYFGERNVTNLAPHKREAAMVFQSYALWPHLTVAKNISFGLEERKIEKSEIKRRVDEALAMVKLDGYGDRSIDAMSGGQQQRVALARALVVRPKCLLLDEPLSNLDAQLRIEMRREIRRIVNEFGLTAIYVTHDQEEALAMADRMAILAKGVIEQLGTAEDIYRNPQTSYVAKFIGETNLLYGVITQIDNAKAIVDVGILFPTKVRTLHEKLNVQDKVMISIRPESLRISDHQSDVKGEILEKVYLGQKIEYLVETGIGKLKAIELNPRNIYNVGESIFLTVDHDEIVLLKN
jgi:iron(III) transport system ATP-binding protein